MAFFKFTKRLQLLIIAGALAAAPGCYKSIDRTGDVGGDDVTSTDPARDDGYESWPDAVDPAPGPQCDVVPSMTMSTVTDEASATHLVARVNLDTSDYVECYPRPLCLEAVTPGPGAVTGVEQASTNEATFRYENEAMNFWDQVTLELTWYVNCYDEYFNEYTEEVSKTVYLCMDESLGTIMMTESWEMCPMVVDCVPSPISALEKQGKVHIAALHETDTGAVRLELRGRITGIDEVRWECSAGRIEELGPGKVDFFPDSDLGIQVVQASILTPRGVIVEIYRYRKV
jgi:hypothetical protein